MHVEVVKPVNSRSAVMLEDEGLPNTLAVLGCVIFELLADN